MVNFLPFSLKAQFLLQNIAGFLHKDSAWTFALFLRAGKIIFPLPNVSQKRPALGGAKCLFKAVVEIFHDPFQFVFLFGVCPVKRAVSQDNATFA